MKNVKQDYDDDLRPEYTLFDFANSVRGKYAYVELDFVSFASAAVVCVGEIEELRFIPHSVGDNRAHRRRGDWTYEIDDANQITLRYWLNTYRRADVKSPQRQQPAIERRTAESPHNPYSGLKGQIGGDQLAFATV